MRTIGKHLAYGGAYSAFSGTTQSQSADLASSVDPGKIRIRYYPITPEGININEFDSYLEQLQNDPSYQEVLKRLQLENHPYVFREEVETAVSRPIPFENIESMDVVSPDGKGYTRVESDTFDRPSIKRYIFSDWKSWLKRLEKHNLLQGDK